ncbi:hypothetical protein WS62_19585 [Burkholderia sp. ABCPW 14]|uniref:hypothetical protein n=1 Tax=Burkholderia sp. ABCPW 14 TaxID=1637860 RepID=UPI000770BB5B|nr:hypothetical protein [Burkholderia sp. ABCPW 14]KVD85338.1 hypothetical protein WS62_19585 [Burkholderia sp. ABCPW 14]
MTIKVRQRDFKILLPGDRERELFTENIGPCTGVAGTNGKGVAFLCHLDSPYSAFTLRQIRVVLEESNVDFGTLKIRVVSSLFGWLYPGWWPTKLSIYYYILSWGLPRLPWPASPSGWFQRVSMHVNADTGDIKISEPHYQWIDKADYDPIEVVKKQEWKRQRCKR